MSPRTRRFAGYTLLIALMAGLGVIQLHEGEITEIERLLIGQAAAPSPSVESHGPAVLPAETGGNAGTPESTERKPDSYRAPQPPAEDHNGFVSSDESPATTGVLSPPASDGGSGATDDYESAGADNPRARGTGASGGGGSGGGFGGGGGRMGADFGPETGINSDGSPGSFFLVSNDTGNNPLPGGAADSFPGQTGGKPNDPSSPFTLIGDGGNEVIPLSLSTPGKNTFTDDDPNGNGDDPKQDPPDRHSAVKVPDTTSVLGLFAFSVLCLAGLRRRVVG